MERRRRTQFDMARRSGGDGASRLSLGRSVRATRRRRMRLESGAALAAAVGLKRTRIGDIERGEGTGTPLIVWVRLGIALRRPIAISFSRDLEAPTACPTPVTSKRRSSCCDLLERPAAPARSSCRRSPESPSLSVDVCVRDDPHRTLILHEIWNRFDDFGRAVRSTRSQDRRSCRARHRDRRRRSVSNRIVLAARRQRARPTDARGAFPEVLAARFPGSSLKWVRALTDGGPSRRTNPALRGSTSGRAGSCRSGAERVNGLRAVSCSGHARAPTPDRHGHLPVHGHRGFDPARPGPRACRLCRAPRAAQRDPPGGVRAARRHRARDAGRFLPRAVHRGTRGGRGGRRGAARPARGHVARRRGSPRPDGPPLRTRHARRRRLRRRRHPSGGPDRGRGPRRAGARLGCDAVARGGPAPGRRGAAAARRARVTRRRSAGTALPGHRRGSSRPSSRRSSRLVDPAAATSRPA